MTNDNLNLSDLLTPAEAEFFATQRQESLSRLDNAEAEQIAAIRARFADERLQLTRRVLLGVLSAQVLGAPCRSVSAPLPISSLESEPHIIMVTPTNALEVPVQEDDSLPLLEDANIPTLTDTVEIVESPVEKPVVNILNETNGQIIQEPTLTESILTEIIGENFTQVLPSSVSEPMPLPISLPRGMLSSVQFAQRLQVAPSTLSGYIKQGLVVPAGQYLSRGMKSMCFRPSQLDPLRVILRQKAMERKAPPVGAAYTKSAAPEGFLTSKEAAAMLGVTASALCKAVSIGTLKIHTPGGSGKLGIFEREEIERYRAQKAIVPPAPAFDTNEEGRFEAIDHGRSFFRDEKKFNLWRICEPSGYKWRVASSDQATGIGLEGGEIVERWNLTGLGKWESTPNIPGGVGVMQGVTRGAIVGSVLG